MRLAHPLSVIQVVKATINVNIFSQYDFTRAECEDGVVADVIGDGMYGDLILDETVSCSDRVGVQSSDLIGGRPAAYSLGNSSGFLKTLQEPDEFPGFAVEVWITLGKDLKPWYPCEHIGSCEYVIISIHNNTLGPIMDYCQETTDFQLSYDAFYRSFKVLMRYDSDSCTAFNTFETNLSKEDLQYPFQLVFTTADTMTKNGKDLGLFLWFINGTYVDWDVSYNQLDFKRERLITSWHEGYNVQFLDKVRHNTSTWFEERATKLYRARIFSERVALVGEYETVAVLFAEGVANSAPVSYNVTVEINEDGEAGDHYYDPGLYLQAFAVTELQNIYLDIYDSDNDPTTLNYNNDTFSRAFINVLPHIGHIFDPRSGGVIASTPYEVLGEGGVFPVKYRPLLNECSSSSNTSDPYTTFSYYAEDGATTGHRSIDNATVHVYVVPKNDPPRASNLTFNMFAATQEIILNLLQGASDVDDFNEVQGAEIYEVPQKGTIYQVYADGRPSTTILSAGERVWTGHNISYRFDISTLRSNLPPNQMVGTDSFTYRVYDLDQNYSLPATVNIVVYTASRDGKWQRLRTMTYFFLAALSTFAIMILSYKLFVVFFRSRLCSFNFGRKKSNKGDDGKSEDNKGKCDKGKYTIVPSRGNGMSALREDGHHKKRASAGKKSTSKKSTNKKSTSEKSTSRTTKKGANSRRSQDKPVKAVKTPRGLGRVGHATVVPTITSAQQRQPPANGRHKVPDIEQN